MDQAPPAQPPSPSPQCELSFWDFENDSDEENALPALLTPLSSYVIVDPNAILTIQERWQQLEADRLKRERDERWRKLLIRVEYLNAARCIQLQLIESTRGAIHRYAMLNRMFKRALFNASNVADLVRLTDAPTPPPRVTFDYVRHPRMNCGVHQPVIPTNRLNREEMF